MPDFEGQLTELVAEKRPEKTRQALAFYRRFLTGTPAGEKLLERLEQRLGNVADFEKPDDPSKTSEPFQIATDEVIQER